MCEVTTDNRTRIERLLNYKRYIDWLIERELKRFDKRLDHDERKANHAQADGEDD